MADRHVSNVDLQQGGLLVVDSGAMVAAGSEIVFHGGPATDTQAGIVVNTTTVGAVVPGVIFYGFGNGNTITINNGDPVGVSCNGHRTPPRMARCRSSRAAAPTP